MTTPDIACAAAEIALNRYLRLEPAVAEECGRLAPRCIELRFTGVAASQSASPFCLARIVTVPRPVSVTVVLSESVAGPLTT